MHIDIGGERRPFAEETHPAEKLFPNYFETGTSKWRAYDFT